MGNQAEKLSSAAQTKQVHQTNSAQGQHEHLDHRPTSILQQRLQDEANQSPQVQQLQASEQLLNHGQRSLQLQALAHMMNPPSAVASQCMADTPLAHTPLQAFAAPLDHDRVSPHGNTLQAMPSANPHTAVLQAVIYKGHNYAGQEKQFVTDATPNVAEHIQLPEPPRNEIIHATLSAISHHDPTATIASAEELIQMFDLGQMKKMFDGEMKVVQISCDNIKAVAQGTLSEVSSIEIKAVTANMHIVKKEVGAIKAVPVQDNKLDEIDSAADTTVNIYRAIQQAASEVVPASSAAVSVAPNKKQAKSKKAIPTTEQAKQPLTRIITQSSSFPSSFLKSAYRWRALGALGVTSGGDGRRHLNIGPKTKTGELAKQAPEKFGTLWASPWSPGINELWLSAGAGKALDFHLVEAPTAALAETLRSGNVEHFKAAAQADAALHNDKPEESYYWNLETKGFTRLGQEIFDLLNQGYRLE